MTFEEWFDQTHGVDPQLRDHYDDEWFAMQAAWNAAEESATKEREEAVASLRGVSKRLKDMLGFAAPEQWPVHVERVQEDLAEVIEDLSGKS